MIRTQKYLDDKATAARELYAAGKITADEMLRVCIDAESGKDTGEIVYLPEREWTQARLAAQARRTKKGGL